MNELTNDYTQMGIAYKKYHDHVMVLAQKYFFLYFKTIKLKGFSATHYTYLDDEINIEEVCEEGEYVSAKCIWTTYCYGEPQDDSYYVCFTAEELGRADVDEMIVEKVVKASEAIVKQQELEAIQQAELKKAKELQQKARKYQQYLELKKQFEV